MKRYLAFAFVVVYIIGLGYVVDRFWDLSLISGVGWKVIAFLTLLNMLALGLFGEASRATCVALGRQLSRTEAIGIASVNSLLNYLPFRPGAGFQAAYLISVVGLSLSKFMLFGGFLLLTILICNGFVGIIASVFEWRLFSPEHVVLGMLAGIYALIALAGIVIMIGVRLIQHLWLPFKLQRFTKAISSNLYLLTGNSLFMIRVYGIIMGILVILTIKTYVMAQLLEIGLTITGAFLLCTASTVARVVSIFPGGLGIVEAAMSATYVILGGNLESGILLSVVDRIINLIATVIMGGSWLLFSRKQIRLLLSEKEVKG